MTVREHLLVAGICQDHCSTQASRYMEQSQMLSKAQRKSMSQYMVVLRSSILY